MRYRHFFLSYFPSVVLAVIACVQLLASQVVHITPWKGGGFGMFSTVDSLAARFLKVYLVTPDGDVPVKVPKHMEEKVRYIRSVPLSSSVQRLAHDLSQEMWVLNNYQDFAQASNKSRRQQSDLLEKSSSTHSSNNGTKDFNDEVAISPSIVVPPKYRVRERYENPNSSSVAQFTAVRVELWVYRFDSKSSLVNIFKYIDVTVGKK